MNMAKKTLIAAATALCLNPVAMAKDYEQEKSKNAAIGLGTGMVVGAVIAGPIGAGVAGILGAMIGENKAATEALTDSREELAASQAALTASQKELFAVRDSLNELQQQATITHVGLTSFPNEQVMAMESAIQFKTGSENIEALYTEQLDLIAKALRSHKGLAVRLTGYADYRGDSDFNQLLSEQRANAVKTALTERGVSSEQISLLAVGEAGSTSNSPESTFFDRKVVMQIMPDENGMTAQR
ncbi:hypothetical protein BFC18_15300 [Alteromonas confluentis]|uniref:OmpA-like domain-containing protein n=2 Tax=Alteromonas confluentis TaxID=1656094 RepID=A0A1E7Z8Y6_9ALTE|nr:hypothetical protein BFC18_15300 [Alteromonas confluentis]